MLIPASLSILVADENEPGRSLVRRLAEALGFSVAEAGSVREITAWLHARSGGDLGCLLIADPFPDGDAFDALAAAKAIHPDFPVVLLTADGNADIILRLLNSGAWGYVETSTLSEARLGQAIRRAMRSKGASSFGEHALLAAAFQQLPSGLLLTDRFGNVLLHNARWIHLLGQTLGTLDNVGEMLERARSTIPNTSSDRAVLLQAIVDNTPQQMNVTLSLDNQETAMVRLTQSPILDEKGQPVGNVVLLEDVEEPQQPRMMHKICHDLRNPLSAIMINANILSREATVVNERRVKLATRILSSASRMNRMIEDLFDYSTAAQGKELSMRPREADMNLIASETIADIGNEFPGRALLLEANGDLRGHWDPARVRQMLHNLIAIALKRGSPRASLRVECVELASPPSVEVRLSIRHDSLTVELPMALAETPAEEEPWEPGLFVAEKIASAHRGTIEMQGRGTDATTFVVRLPKPPPVEGGTSADGAGGGMAPHAPPNLSQQQA